MVARRWRMTPGRIKLVKTIAFRQKGLTEEEYRVRLKAITTRDSCKQLKRAEFLRFVNDLQRLPDAPTARVRAQHRRAA